MDLDHSRSSLERLLDAMALWLPVGCDSDPHEARLRGMLREDGPIHPDHRCFICPCLSTACTGLST
jgi:hypothetical protein